MAAYLNGNPNDSCGLHVPPYFLELMRREFIQELRGDARREAIDIYNHIDLKELKEAYLAAIPQLGI